MAYHLNRFYFTWGIIGIEKKVLSSSTRNGTRRSWPTTWI